MENKESTPVVVESSVTSESTAKPEITPEAKQEIPQGMVLIPGGKFEMGSENGKDNEKPVHTVEVSSFFMDIYELTNQDYCVFLNSMGNQTEGADRDGNLEKWIETEEDIRKSIKDLDLSEEEINEEECLKYYGITGGTDPGTFKVKSGYESCPVVDVTWYGAVAYANWLSEQEGLEKCYGEKENRGNVNINANGYRLPTEAEWEYACRAGTTNEYYWGDKMDLDSGDYCWYWYNSGERGKEMYHPVGQKKPNKYGLYDMSGNVWERCSDWYGDYSSGYVKNPVGPTTGSYRILRGGSIAYLGGGDCRSAERSFDFLNTSVGFRLVRSAP